MLFLCYPKCSTCRKAQSWLDDHGISYELRDIKLNHPTAGELTDWYRKSGLPLKKFFNTSGLLATDGMLVKRPLLIGDAFVLAGFRPADWEAALQ